MAGFDHGPIVGGEQDSAATSARNSKYGLVLFGVYLLCYGYFVILNAFWPSLVSETRISGINLAIFGGLSLIALAFAQSLIYSWICRRPVE